MNLVILGSARKESNTLKAIEELCPLPKGEYEIIDLNDYRIELYNYGEYSDKDEFLTIAKKMQEADKIVFATPVYWYAMSAVMKVFFDRMTGLITKNKTIGRSLAGKETYLISTGSDPELPPGFEEPFRLTSKYFDMNYSGAFYRSTKA